MTDRRSHLLSLSSVQRRALLAQLTRSHSQYGRSAPLSYAQQRLWFLQRFAPDSPHYNETSVFRLQTCIDATVLEEALNEIVRRHEALRTVFVVEDGLPLQRVLTSLRIPVRIVDLTLSSAERREAEWNICVRDCALQPFDLTTGPLLRAGLIRVTSTESIFVLTLHHIVCDGWSMNVFFRELRELYEASVVERQPQLPALQIQYADFAVWQRRWLDDAALAPQLAYWSDQLADAARLELPTDMPRPRVPTFSGAREPLRVSSEVYARFKQLCEQEQTTSFMGLLALFQVLLHRRSGQDDICVGCPIAGRNRPELESLIGFFVNTLVMRTDLSGSPTFRELLRRVREIALSAFANQDVPFEKLVERLQPTRDPSRNPLYQVTFQLLNAPIDAETIDSAVFEVVDVSVGTAKFDLRCDLWETTGGLTGYIEYSADLFTAQTGAAIARQFETLIEAAVHTPHQRIGALSLMPPSEEARLLELLRGPQLQLRPECVHTLFERHARNDPERLAVVESKRTLTYAELNREANQLARRLRKHGVVPGSLVAIVLPRSLEYVISILGVVKAGAAYVPLDPDQPVERLQSLLSQAQISLVVTSSELRAQAGLQTTVVPIDDCRQHGGESETDLPAQSDQGSLAYVVFTSGTTGQPKGVEVGHLALANLVEWHLRQYRVVASDRAMLYSNPAFDASVWELWPYLVAGASVWIAPEETRLMPSALVQWWRTSKITLAFAPTPIADMIFKVEDLSDLKLRTLLVGGERLVEYPPLNVPFKVVNHYGPAENAVVTTAVDLTSRGRSKVPPIGAPIANVQLYVLDPHMKLVPPGVKGELYVGGVGLARGYLLDNSLSRQRFVQNPFERGRSARLYRTGDIVSYRSDGVLEFHGRSDRQFKVRGMRIEPGDIEAALNTHPLVERALVVPVECPLGTALNAYLVAASTPRPVRNTTSERVRDWKRLYEGIYGGRDVAADAGFDIVGWNSSYDGSALSEQAMREQVEGAVGRVKELGGKRIVEIGCGTGLLLLRLARECELYVGTDFSAEVLERLKEECSRQGLSQVELQQREAEDIEGLAQGSFDGVVLNSVVQYFPGEEYLAQVLRSAQRLLKPQGWIFVGDVRHLGYQSWLHAGVEVRRAKPEQSMRHVQQLLQQRMSQEQELLLEPSWFQQWSERSGEMQVQMSEVKRGWDRNELTKFRYDVVLRGRGQGRELGQCCELSWEQLGSVEALHGYLQAQAVPALRVSGIPSIRLWWERELMARLDQATQEQRVEQLCDELAHTQESGVEAEALWGIENHSEYWVRVQWGARRGDYELACVRRDIAGRYDWWRPALELHEGDEPARYANEVLQQSTAQQREQELRAHLRDRLPAYMMPARFVWLESLPLTGSGKLDRRALPAPPDQSDAGGPSYVPPRGALQEQIAAIWCELLGLQHISVHANFFDLGGHSLLATQVTSRLSQALQKQVPLRLMFEHPTISGMALAIEARDLEAPMPPPIRAMSHLSDAQVSSLLETLVEQQAQADRP